MKIAILNSMQPFVSGGAEFLADSLRDKLIEYGYETQVIRIPFSWHPVDNITDAILAARLMQLPNIDMTIALKFPAYFVEGPKKRLWLLHQFRQAYDLSGTQYDIFTNSESDQSVKHSIIAADNAYLKPLEDSIYTNSKVVSDRLLRYNDVHSEVLYPPLFDAHLYSPDGEYGDYIFYPSRVNHSKRQHIAVEAMRYVKSGVKLVLAGKGDSLTDEDRILSAIEKYGLKDKITYMNRYISQEEKAGLYKNCLGVIYIPFDEDSYGYVTLEGLHSAKPLISCTDAGGTDVVVLDGETGYMTEPDPKELAEAMDKLCLNKSKARAMGRNGAALPEKLGISWETVIRRLTK